MIEKKLHTATELYAYALKVSKYCMADIPDFYFLHQNVWVILDDDQNILAGFAMTNHDMPRTLEEVGSITNRNRYHGWVSEITGFFIIDQKARKMILKRMGIEAIKSPFQEFIYGYSSSNKKLKKYYAEGDPNLIYEGIPNVRSEFGPQRIEVLTKTQLVALIFIKMFKHD